MSNKSAQERPRASQERPRASQERLRSAQERAKSDPRALCSLHLGCRGLYLVACGGSPAALGGRWRGGGEVNLSVNGIMAYSFRTWQPLDKGPADLDRSARSPYPWDPRRRRTAWDFQSCQHPGGARRNPTATCSPFGGYLQPKYTEKTSRSVQRAPKLSRRRAQEAPS